MPKQVGGHLKPEEREFIAANMNLLTPEKIASHIGRTVATVLKHIHKIEVTPAKKQKVTASWKRLELEFEKEEIEYFKEKYALLLSQFQEQDNILATEDNQIMKAIKYDILMSRNLIERKKLRDTIGQLEDLQSQHLSTFDSPAEMTDQDRATLQEMNTQLQMLRTSEQSKYNEYCSLDKQHQQLMEDLKATRKQRINQIAGSKNAFLELLKQLGDRENREREGRQMEMMRRASEKEFKRLSGVHKYADSVSDLPILNAETLEALDKNVEISE